MTQRSENYGSCQQLIGNSSDGSGHGLLN